MAAAGVAVMAAARWFLVPATVLLSRLRSPAAGRRAARGAGRGLADIVAPAGLEAGPQEERFRLIVDALPALVAYVDSRERCRTINQAFLDWFGRSAAEVRGRRVRQLLGDEGYGRVRVHVEAALRGEVVSLETVLPHRDGGSRSISATLVPDRDAGGRVHGFVSLARDVTVLKRVEEGRHFLAEASQILSGSLDIQVVLERLARLVVTRVADRFMVDLLDEKGAVRRVALAHADPAREGPVWEMHRRFPPVHDCPEGISRVLRTGRPVLYEDVSDSVLKAVAQAPEHLRMLSAEGLRSVIVAPLSARGRTLGAIFLGTDQSGRRLGQDDLVLAEDLARRMAFAIDNARLYQEAQEANRMKDDFLAMVSHELRTPLNAMLGWAQLLRTGSLDPETSSQAVESIERSARAQAQLIEDLLDISRITRGKIDLEIGEVELPKVVGSAVGLVLPLAGAKGVEVRSSLDPVTPPVLGDAARLQQVVWNLLSNAVKFTPQGGRVEVRLEREGTRARIQVSDTGKGISPEFLPVVFVRFRQAGAVPPSRRQDGLGLGLAITKHLVDLHGGTVRAESPGEGKGATFIVELPLAPQESQPAAAPKLDTSRRARPPGEPLPRLSGLRVLVVDDEEEARRVITAILETCEAEVEAAASALEALEALERFRPDVLLSDIGMPGEDGYELIRKVRLREAEQGGHIPAAALTAFARSLDRMQALTAGYEVHLPKPVEAAELAAVVARLAERTVAT